MKTIKNEYKELEVVKLIDQTEDIDGCKAIYYETKYGVVVIDYIDTEENAVWHREMFNAENKGNADYAFSQVKTID